MTRVAPVLTGVMSGGLKRASVPTHSPVLAVKESHAASDASEAVHVATRDQARRQAPWLGRVSNARHDLAGCSAKPRAWGTTATSDLSKFTRQISQCEDPRREHTLGRLGCSHAECQAAHVVEQATVLLTFVEA